VFSKVLDQTATKLSFKTLQLSPWVHNHALANYIRALPAEGSSKFPLKIKVFMWPLYKNAILTKDNMLKRNWQGDQHCKFCDKDENIIHLFFIVPWLDLLGV
jgi:hypothetical protein